MFTLAELSLFAANVLASGDDESSGEWAVVFLAAGFVFYAIMYFRYRNTDKRHHHEKETKFKTANVEGGETFVEHRKKLKNARMKDANDQEVRGARAGLAKSPPTGKNNKATDKTDP